MLHGIETEPQARAAYAFEADVDVVEVGLVRHPKIAGTHASPDGLIGGEGLLEIKCPQPAAHLALLLGESIPDKYLVQMLWQMACAERGWCDFVSYNPAFPAHLRLLVKRIHRDDERIAQLEREVIAFLSELDAAARKLAA
jgi:predicted phage-related endonuclease